MKHRSSNTDLRTLASRETVFAECDRLFRAGKRPTQQAVRSALGGGSPNGISKYMGEWQEMHLARFLKLEEASRSPRPPEVPEALWKALLPIWDQLVSEAAITSKPQLRSPALPGKVQGRVVASPGKSAGQKAKK